MEELTIFTPATVANVSCAFDVLGFALDNVGDEMTFKKTDNKGVKIKMLGNSNLPTEPDKNVAGVVAMEMLKKANADFGILIEIDKKIKPGSGIGSSAASSAGAAYGVNKFLGNIFNKIELVQFAMLGEKLASGIAHADNVAPAIFGGFALVRSYSPLDIIKINSPEKLFCTVIHPQIEVKTENARKILKKDVLLKDAVEQWGNVAGLISGLHSQDYELIGRSLQDKIVEPVRSVLIPLFLKVKQAFLEAGALGGGISGSGPSIFSLSKGLETAEKVAEAMKKVYSQTGIDFDIHVSRINSVGIKEI
ncbi:MAG: homoserine kinase [Bacteroidetes bacterium]|nr:MAG: homoserine kinase [Bacteroidota bacterium]